MLERQPSEMLEGRKIDLKPVQLSVRLPPMREVSCALDFVGKIVMQTWQLKQENAMSEVYLKHFPSLFITTYYWLGKGTRVLSKF